MFQMFQKIMKVCFGLAIILHLFQVGSSFYFLSISIIFEKYDKVK